MILLRTNYIAYIILLPTDRLSTYIVAYNLIVYTFGQIKILETKSRLYTRYVLLSTNRLPSIFVYKYKIKINLRKKIICIFKIGNLCFKVQNLF